MCERTFGHQQMDQMEWWNLKVEIGIRVLWGWQWPCTLSLPFRESASWLRRRHEAPWWFGSWHVVGPSMRGLEIEGFPWKLVKPKLIFAKIPSLFLLRTDQPKNACISSRWWRSTLRHYVTGHGYIMIHCDTFETYLHLHALQNGCFTLLGTKCVNTTEKRRGTTSWLTALFQSNTPVDCGSLQDSWMQRLGSSRSTGHTVVEMSWKHEATHAETSRHPGAIHGAMASAAGCLELWRPPNISKYLAMQISSPSQQMPFLAVDENSIWTYLNCSC